MFLGTHSAFYIYINEVFFLSQIIVFKILICIALAGVWLLGIFAFTGAVSFYDAGATGIVIFSAFTWLHCFFLRYGQSLLRNGQDKKLLRKLAQIMMQSYQKFHLMIWQLLYSRAEICQIFCGFLGKSKISKGHSEINWPLECLKGCISNSIFPLSFKKL